MDTPRKNCEIFMQKVELRDKQGIVNGGKI